MQQYRVSSIPKDPSIQLKLPEKILQDLELRSKENGQTVEVEIAMRLARSLERDLAMVAFDNELAYLAFQRIEKDRKKAKRNKRNV